MYYVWVIFRSRKLKNTVKYDIFKIIKKTKKYGKKIFKMFIYFFNYSIYTFYKDILYLYRFIAESHSIVNNNR